MQSKPLRIYTASCLQHAAMWAELIVSPHWREFTWTATWPQAVLADEPEDEHAAKNFWEKDIAEISTSDVVLLYCEPKDNLRGALVEVGAALGLDLRVMVVGDNQSLGTWIHHPRVYRASTFIGARRMLKYIARCVTLEG